MAILSNQYFFPLLQVGLLGLLAFALRRDYGTTPDGVFVKRGLESMKTLQWVTGLVIAAIVTIINKSVFDDDAGWRHYSAIINAVDLGAIVYLCYFSPWSRNHILGLFNRLTEERPL
jgi:hypothetical protein